MYEKMRLKHPQPVLVVSMTISKLEMFDFFHFQPTLTKYFRFRGYMALIAPAGSCAITSDGFDALIERDGSHRCSSVAWLRLNMCS